MLELREHAEIKSESLILRTDVRSSQHRASDNLQDAQRDRQTQEASSSSVRLAIFLLCLVFQERMVQVASTVKATVVALVSYRGTHQGAFRAISPTDKPISVMGINIFRIVNGKMVEHWGLADRLSTLQQLGVVPTPGPVS